MLQHHPHTIPLGAAARIKEESTNNQPFFFAHSNPIDNAAAAAAAAAAGLIDHQHRDLHTALVNVAAVNGTLSNTTAAVLKSQSVQQQQQNNAAQQTAQAQAAVAAAAAAAAQAQQQQSQQNTVNNNASAQQQQQQQQSQQNAMVLLNGNAGTAVGGNNGTANGVVKTSSSGRSTPVNGSSTTDPAPGKLFVGGLSWQTSSEKLKEYFNVFGTVTDVLIMKDPVTQRSRGFGFITFQEPCSVDKVLQVPIHTLDGKKIDPKHATPKNRPRQANKTKKIFVGGVSQDTSADEVKAYFNQFGTVEETVMLMDQQTKRHRGFGFVTFENEDVVDRVCEIHFHTIKNKKVECKKAQPKEAVTPAAAQLLQKRIMLSTLGVPIPTAPGQLIGTRAGVTTMSSLAMLQAPSTLQLHAASGAAAAAAAQQAALISQSPFQVQNAAAAAAVAANPASFGKLLTTYPQALHSVRYAPYPIPTSAAAANALVQAQQQHVAAQQQQHANAAAAAQQQHTAHAAAAAAAQQHNAANTQNVAAAQNAHNALAVAGPAAGASAHGAQAAHHPLAAAAAQQAALVAGNPLSAAANPYQSYTLTNVDMSSFQGVDWSQVYGMGMYV
ncbi:poly(U)-binding-splicing factor PUF60 isoform X1 [Anastrepha obliqua]|uniref:poly(U)-binding-splicing factor PUF60 isoform X1 n=1 Tax=Anastrepha obliqua TaxID=95512 RepID=UPI00240A4969|nr:poly(U)-binding-splicing factor PUF60 isoform X1 [Anastrepha obliqua]